MQYVKYNMYQQKINLQSMQTSTTTFSQLKLSHFKKPNKLQLPKYIPNQQASDNQLSILLDMITQCNSLIQLKQQQKTKQYIKKMAKQLQKINQHHRSFMKIKSLVLGCTILVLIDLQQINKIKPFLLELQKVDRDIGNNLYLAKMYLIKILVFTFQRNMLDKMQQSVNVNANDIENDISDNYQYFNKIKFSADGCYFDFRLWEDCRLIEILIYQFILIVQKLTEYDQIKGTFLYKRGLEIAKKVLGKEHKLTQMLSKIRKIRLQTNKLLKSSSTKGNTSTINQFMNSTTKTSKIKSKSLINKKLQYILNPQQILRTSKIRTQISQSLSKNSNYNNNGKQHSMQLPNIEIPYRYRQNKSPINNNNNKTNSNSQRNASNIAYLQSKMKQLDDNMEIIISHKIGNNQNKIIPKNNNNNNSNNSSKYSSKKNSKYNSKNNKQRKSIGIDTYIQTDLQQQLNQNKQLNDNNKQSINISALKQKQQQKQKLKKQRNKNKQQENRNRNSSKNINKSVQNIQQNVITKQKNQQKQKEWACQII